MLLKLRKGNVKKNINAKIEGDVVPVIPGKNFPLEKNQELTNSKKVARVMRLNLKIIKKESKSCEKNVTLFAKQ